MRTLIALVVLAQAVAAQTAGEAKAAADRAFGYFRETIACRGGYLWSYREDLTERRGEGDAAETTIWVQKPGTPAVGLVYLRMYDVTGDAAYLDAATETGLALAWGQLASGGWDYRIEFGEAAAGWYYRRNLDAGDGERGRRRNTSTLDDDNTQLALRFLMELDQRLEFAETTIHRAAQYGLDALLAAQYPNGAWPQRFDGPAAQHPVLPASYPDEWPREFPGTDYSRFYTLNDNTLRDCIETCFLAHEVYGDERFRAAALRGGEFILLAQMPEPQPAWAQQYDFAMHPVWARRFEPPAVTGNESCGVMRLLIDLWLRTGDAKWIAPLPAAMRWFGESQIEPNRWARFYELRTNRPLYFVAGTYELTYDGGNVPTHYSFSGDYASSTLRYCEQTLERGREAILAEREQVRSTDWWRRRADELAPRVVETIAALDQQGRWLADGRVDVAQFNRNLSLLIDYLEARGLGE